LLPKSLVGEAEVKDTSAINNLQKGAGHMNALNRNGDFRGRPHPTRYEIIDKNGAAFPIRFLTAQAAAEHAKGMWPDQEQDPDRTGKGWDVQVVGS